MDVAAIILAGGEARRLGGVDKALVEVAGRPLLSHVAARLSEQCAHLALSSNADPARYAAYDLPVLADGTQTAQGPLAGLIAGMGWAAQLGASHLLSVPVDTPFVPLDLAAKLRAAAGAGGAAIASSGGRAHPVVGLWPVGLARLFQMRLDQGQRQMMGAVEAAEAVTVTFEAQERPDPFFNVNTPEDVTAAAALLR